MENMAILNTTALDFVEDYNRVDIWKKRLCWVGWFMFEAVLLKNNDCLLYPNYSLFTLQEVQKTANSATLLRLVYHFFSDLHAERVLNNSPALLCVTSMRSRVTYDSRTTDWIKPP